MIKSRFCYFLLFPLLSLAGNLWAQPEKDQEEAVVVDHIIAKVNDQIILKSELEGLYYQTLNSQQSLPDVAHPRCQLLEQMLVNKMMLAKADMDSINVKDAIVQDELERRMEVFSMQYGGKKRIEEQYGKSMGQLKEDLHQKVEEQLITDKVRNQITSNVEVTPAEVKEYYNKMPADSIPYLSAEVKVGKIVRYPEFSREQKKQVKQELMDIRSRVVDGNADFAQMASLYSEDPGSAKNGGDLGMVERGQMVPPFEGAALRLEEGEISEPVETKYGFHLIKLIERRGKKYRARHILLKPSYGEKELAQARHLLDSLRQQILDSNITFEKAATEFSEDEATKNNGGYMMDQQTQNAWISVEKLEPDLFFKIDKMEPGTITEPKRFTTQQDKPGFKIIYYAGRKPPHMASLEKDYQKLRQAALNQKKSKAIQRWFDKTKDDVYISIDPEYDKCQILERFN